MAAIGNIIRQMRSQIPASAFERIKTLPESLVTANTFRQMRSQIPASVLEELKTLPVNNLVTNAIRQMRSQIPASVLEELKTFDFENAKAKAQKIQAEYHKHLQWRVSRRISALVHDHEPVTNEETTLDWIVEFLSDRHGWTESYIHSLTNEKLELALDSALEAERSRRNRA